VPIFVVGPSRSGTGLVRHLLNRHSRLWLTGETHYFDDLRLRMKGRERFPLIAADRETCESYFLALARGAYRVDVGSNESRIAREELRELADSVGVGSDAYFEAFCRLNAKTHEKADWGEKTPRHVFRIDEILEAYPRARVIALVRDPRAVVVSYRDLHARPMASPEREELLAEERKRAKRSYHVLLASLLWRAAVRATLNAVAKHGPERVRLQRFEDLVQAPEQTLSDLGGWLGIPFEETMLDVNVVSSSHRLDREESGISSEPAERWRSKLDRSEIVAIESCAGRLMREVGYTDASGPGSKTRHVARAWLTLPSGVVRASLANRSRIGGFFEYVRRRARLAATR
jgi:sulfotransferase family protein